MTLGAYNAAKARKWITVYSQIKHLRVNKICICSVLSSVLNIIQLSLKSWDRIWRQREEDGEERGLQEIWRDFYSVWMSLQMKTVFYSCTYTIYTYGTKCVCRIGWLHLVSVLNQFIFTSGICQFISHSQQCILAWDGNVLLGSNYTIFCLLRWTLC